MTPLPKKKRSHTRQTTRKLALAWQPERLNYCPNCKSPILPHRVCTNCGYYKGKQFIKIEEEAVVRKVSDETK